ncbi:MAG: hypothetical protein EA412_01245 [Chitinophagaceae bacterium]|nr:MAG: hypothetical protein EA412_01245 [Chitinophagaceae bacterium]
MRSGITMIYLMLSKMTISKHKNSGTFFWGLKLLSIIKKVFENWLIYIHRVSFSQKLSPKLVLPNLKCKFFYISFSTPFITLHNYNAV